MILGRERKREANKLDAVGYSEAVRRRVNV